ncbi:hypothetical protein MARPU_10180 [Marichromatium purpuratum 984]|uniref:Nucleotide-diphospho-sugar transferase domain-containing protein n=1 Tax=Marichromatium purpuratum 984 TaxID=765910 RepID=W0E7M6_MARPU|nr:DUF6492 family protein [Marichromatium purpuratum]AHF05528.1 hypothetical protein MARPU_10180 [Marichromatium purpuratum 984]
MSRIALITPSYAPDFDRCRILCDSVERFLCGHDEHLIIVDRQDQALFSRLVTARTRLLLKEEILPGWLHKIPFSRKWWLNLHGLPVRGWILQQIVKLSVAEAIDADLFVFADSDVVFIRPFDCADVLDAQGRARLYAGPRKPEDIADPRHRAWYRFAGKLFGLSGEGFQQHDYISQLVVWRRDTLEQLTSRIAAQAGRSWQRVLANTLDFSEYELYGIFAEHVLGAHSGHFLTDTELSYCSWHHPISSREDLLGFLRDIPDRYPAVLIQSNLGIEPADYARILGQLE